MFIKLTRDKEIPVIVNTNAISIICSTNKNLTRICFDDDGYINVKETIEDLWNILKGA